MTPIEENAQLSTDLDCQFNDLKNVRNFYPVPGNLVHIDDPRLSDPRNMLPGSVTNESVYYDAAIVQSKLNLNGVIPPNWFAPVPDIDIPTPLVYPVRGDKAELTSRKGAVNGYAAIDANLRLLPGNVTPGPGGGTVSEVLFSFPDQFADLPPVTGLVINHNLTWKPVLNNSWFGVFGDTGAGVGGPITDPEFHVELLPIELMPSLDCAKFKSGLFDPEVLPVAVGIGEGHAPGMVPDPGEVGDSSEYLGRDMDWHHFGQYPYQPSVTQPTITLISIQTTTATVTIRTEVPGAILFYRAGRPGFSECPSEFTIHVSFGTLVEAYTAKQGYNNSPIVSYLVPVPGGDEPALT